MTELGYAAGRLDPKKITGTANRVGRELGVPGVARFFYRPYLYLNDEKIAAAGVDPAAVEQAIADALTDLPGIELAVC